MHSISRRQGTTPLDEQTYFRPLIPSVGDTRSSHESTTNVSLETDPGARRPQISPSQTRRLQGHPGLECRGMVTSWLPHGLRSSGQVGARPEIHLYPCPKKRHHLCWSLTILRVPKESPLTRYEFGITCVRLSPRYGETGPISDAQKGI